MVEVFSDKKSRRDSSHEVEIKDLHAKPEIFTTDQGSHFTSVAFTQVLKDASVKISMDGRGRWMDNVMIQRPWRSLKYECAYPQAFETGSQARTGIGGWIDYFNTSRPHSVFGGRTPEEVYTGRGAPFPGHGLYRLRQWSLLSSSASWRCYLGNLQGA